MKTLLNEELVKTILKLSRKRIEKIIDLKQKLLGGLRSDDLLIDVYERFRSFNPYKPDSELVVADGLLELQGENPRFVKAYGEELFDSVEIAITNSPLFAGMLMPLIKERMSDFANEETWAEKYGRIYAQSLYVYESYKNGIDRELHEKISGELDNFLENFVSDSFLRGFLSVLKERGYEFPASYSKSIEELFFAPLTDKTKEQAIYVGKNVINQKFTPEDIDLVVKLYSNARDSRVIKAFTEILTTPELVKAMAESVNKHKLPEEIKQEAERILNGKLKSIESRQSLDNELLISRGRSR